LTLRQAIATSCDVFFYQLGLALGADSILAGARSLGFGARSGIDLGQDSHGILNASVKEYVNSRGASTWGSGETLNLAIGQGHHTETLMNMVSFYAALAGDGIKRAPHIIQGRPEEITTDMHLSPAILADLRQAMVDVINSGTATGALASEAGLKLFQIAGKTGTAEISGQKQMGWFIAFAPADSPKIVVGIVVEEGIHGSLVAKFPVRAIVNFLTGKSVKANIDVITEDTLHIGVDTGTVIPDSTPAVHKP
jgi:penicillin-binding protein 2